jgi:hypothetical protein
MLPYIIQNLSPFIILAAKNSLKMRISVLIVLLIHFICLSGYSQGIRLAINLPDGYRFNTEASVNLGVEQEFMGIRYNTQMEIITLMRMEVKGIDVDSNYIISARYQKMNIRVTSVLINMEVSSESLNPADSLSSILRKLQGMEFRILLNRKGEIIDITGLDEMIREISLSSNLPHEQKIEFTQNLIQSLGKEALQDNYRSNSSFYPDHIVNEMDQWEFSLTIMKNGIPMRLNSHIRLKDVSKNKAILISEGRISSQRNYIDQSSILSPDQTYYLTGSEISEIKIDLKTGLILESIVSQNVTGSIKTHSEEKKDQEILIPFKITSRSTIITSPIKL